MDYQKIYDDICKRGQERILPKEIYTEKHHIIPKCMGGSNEKSNLTVLTAKEHFLVHYILAEKLYPNHYGLYHSLYLMCHMKSQYQCRYEVSSRAYETIRNNAINLMKEYKRSNPPVGDKNGMFGKNHSERTKNIISESRRGKPTRFGPHTEETKNKIRETKKQRKDLGYYENSQIGKHIRSDEYKRKCSEIMKEKYSSGELKKRTNFKHSEETKKKMSNARAGKQFGDKNNNARPVLHVSSGQIFGSRKSARLFFKLSPYKFIKLFNEGIFCNLTKFDV